MSLIPVMLCKAYKLKASSLHDANFPNSIPFFSFYRSERQKQTDRYGETGGKRGVVVFCFVHGRCAIGLPKQLNCGMRKCDRDVKPLQDQRSSG